MAGILSPFMMGAPQQFQGAQPTPMPQQPVQAQGRFSGFREMMSPDIMMPVAAGLLSGRTNAEGFANAFGAMGQGMGQSRQRNKTLAYLQQNDPEVAQLVEATGMDIKDAYAIHQQRVKAQMPNVPDSIQALQMRAQMAGLQPGSPEYQKFMAAGGDKGINVNVDTGTIPQGYEAVRDDNGRVVRYQPVPGGPADTSGADAARQQNLATSTDTITKAASRARTIAKDSGRWATGIGGQIIGETLGIGESSAGELRDQVAVLQANAKIENLQAMRAASPTGGALGAVSDSENAMLAAKAGALNPNAHPDVFQQQLDDYELSLLRVIHGYDAGTQIFEQSRQQNPDYYSKYGLEQ